MVNEGMPLQRVASIVPWIRVRTWLKVRMVPMNASVYLHVRNCEFKWNSTIQVTEARRDERQISRLECSVWT